MFKKFLVSLMAFCLVSVQAQATSGNNLKAVFDDLTYTLAVEWDQKDQTVYAQAMQKFTAEIKTLQDQGLTNQELIESTLAQVKDAKLANDLRTAFTMVQINKMSPKEAQVYVNDVMKKSYSQGAHFVGTVIVSAIVIVAIVAAVLVLSGNARVEDGCYEVYQCDDYCTGNICYEDCSYKCVDV